MNPRNAIILTGGLTGSSVLAGLIARAGYWKGEQTFQKQDYNTNENERLIALNKQLLEAAQCGRDYTERFSQESIDRVAALWGKVDPAPFADFIRECDAHRPWIWKDPRLWMTIRFWQHLLDPQQVAYVLLTRDTMQKWISAIINRQIESYAYVKQYNGAIDQSLLRFLEENRLPFLDITYEDIVVRPESAVERLNAHLGTGLDMNDLKSAYKGPLYRKPRGFRDFVLACLIYAKNYSERRHV